MVRLMFLRRYHQCFRYVGVCIALLFAVHPRLVWSQPPPAEWTSLDGSPPGTPAELNLAVGQSSPEQSILQMTIHGFWTREETGNDGQTYQKITVPGMGSHNQVGAPDLPAYKGMLAVLTQPPSLALIQHEIVDDRVFTGMRVWPQALEESEPIEGGMPERFIIDNEIYEMNLDWPGIPARADSGMSTIGGNIPIARYEIYPFQWNPSTRTMHVAHLSTYVFDHSGLVQQAGPVTRDRFFLAGSLIDNWEIIDQLVVRAWWHYDADYLIIAPRDYHDTLDRFESLKRTQGYHVTVYATEDVGPGCDDYRDAIRAWYALTPSSRDHYCLLVGEASVIPPCSSPYLNVDYPDGVPTDDLYGSVDGDDLDEEVYVGRLSVDDETDLASQIDKIIDYQSRFGFGLAYSQVALVAHEENAPGKYTAAHDKVRYATYNNPPGFHLFYGYLGATNADVSAAIDGGMGVVAYRGHGSSSAWTNWNVAGESYSSTEVAALTNEMLPVVWNIACSNSKFDLSDDCMSETWMEQVGHGAVSVYGATRASYTIPNSELDYQLFQAVYDKELTTQGAALAYAEEEMASATGDANAWMYMLFGDPSMRIKTTQIFDWEVYLPDSLWVDEEYDILVEGEELQPLSGSVPIRGALFSVWKPDSSGVLDEAFDNTYTDENGMATLTIHPRTEGWLYWSLRGTNGHAVLDSIPVVTRLSTDVPGGGTASLRFWAHPAVTSSGVNFRLNQGLQLAGAVSIHDVSGRLIRRLEVREGTRGVRWDGRDLSGRQVAPGVYLARLSELDPGHVTRFVVLR